MAIVRVTPAKAGALTKVSLAEVSKDERLTAARTLREKRWRDDLRPDVGREIPTSVKLGALLEAIELQHAALFPRKEHLLPKDAVEAWRAKQNGRR